MQSSSARQQSRCTAGYDKERDGPLPCLLWAYPREYKSREAAGKAAAAVPGSLEYTGACTYRAYCARFTICGWWNIGNDVLSNVINHAI